MKGSYAKLEAYGRKSPCRVTFARTRFGYEAVLWHKSYTLNMVGLGPREPSATKMLKAKKQLLKGCAELVRAHRRYE